MKSLIPTRIRFYLEPEGILAVFPQMQSLGGKPANICYAHLGQHSLSQTDYHEQLPIAPEAACLPLMNELRQLGYHFIYDSIQK